jgi:uncharacterized membrane protein
MSEHDPQAPEGVPARSDSAPVPDPTTSEPSQPTPKAAAVTPDAAPEVSPERLAPARQFTDGPGDAPWEVGPPHAAPGALSRAALSVSTLAAVGFSLALSVQTAHLKQDKRDEFLISNVLGEAPRKVLLLSLLGGAVFPLLVCGLLWLIKRRRMARGLSTVADLLGPLCLTFSLPLFFIWQFGQQKTTYYLILLTAFVFASRALLTRAFRTAGELTRPAWLRRPRWLRLPERVRWPARLPRPRVPKIWASATLLVVIAGYAAYMAHYTILRHRLIQTMAFDLGIYDNLMFNVIHGRFFKSPVLFGPGKFSYIAGHAEYAMVLFAPIYALRPNAETLLWLQAILIAASAFPLFLFARRFISRGPALIVALAYLMFAPLQGFIFYDFHWLPIAIFFHFWLYYAIAARKNWLVIPLVLVLFAIREDVALGLGLLGIFLFLTGARIGLGVVLTAVSFLWFGINKFIIMPHAGTWWFENIYSELFADGKSTYGSVIVTLVSNPIFALTSFIRENKLVYGLHMVAPLAFLPLRKLAFVLLLIPGCVFTLMTTAYWPTVSIAFQYTSHWIPYLFLCLVLGLWLFKFETDGKAKFYAALVTLVIVVLSHSYNFGGVLQRESFSGGFSRVQFSMSDSEAKRYQALQEIIAKIPRDASVAAGEYMNPHISARKDAYVFRYDVGPVDYIFFSKNELDANFRKMLTDKLQKEPYGFVAHTGDEFWLFKRGLESPETAKMLQQLGMHHHPH